MQVARPAGAGAGSRKYDILSALMVFALGQDKTKQRQVLRLMTLVTTRYNWQRDELSMGQDEIARLWSVDPRTVKREMAKFRTMGWLVTKRQGARGRVSLYGLDLDRMMADTRPDWTKIGPDFVARMAPGESGAPVVKTNVVPLRPIAEPAADGTTWSAAQEILHGQGAAEYGAWLHVLTELDCGAGRMVLSAPSRFHATYVETHLLARVLAAVRSIDPSISSVRLEV
ncbi:hypothetical protein [Palleronia sp.]|uniref:hypothetical protein n=1 Tax=Palleronia sp. TaxID=1940284 RepID=UPI0035C7DC5A